MGQPQAGQPLWSVDSGAAPLYLTRCTGSPWHSLCPVIPVSLRALLSSALFALVSLQVHKKKKKKHFLPLHSHLHLVFTFFSLQEHVCGGTTTPQERFCGASLPTRPILWSVITHKNEFCERQPCPARTTNSRTANFGFH